MIVTRYYLAVDIGASSGRHILGRLHNDRLEIREVHRFKNGCVKRNGHLCWDTDALFHEIIAGMIKCGELGKIPVSMGVDTWGVDFVLLNKDGGALGESVSYRDGRTAGMDAALSEYIGERELYARTGIQKQPFNTIYQFIALKNRQPELLEQAAGFLMIPDYFNYLLTGKRAHEYTNATTTGLVNAESAQWDYELINKAALPERLFGEIAAPGTFLGNLLPEIRARAGFDCDVVLPCTHDTGSAVVAAPIGGGGIYLSSGTWSLMGVELDGPICTEDSRASNFTNEGGYEYRRRYLKNIMGLWIIQNIVKECGAKYSFSDLSEAASQYEGFAPVIDVNDNRFLAPDNMTAEIRAACVQSGQRAPASIGELMSCVYRSLAGSYAAAVNQIEALTGGEYEKICIIGGGSRDTYLNMLTAKACGKKVSAGLVEGSAVGNILVQMIAAKELSGLDEARRLVKQSFPITEFLGGVQYEQLL